MKTIALILAILFSTVGFTQNDENQSEKHERHTFTYNTEGLNPNHITVNVNGMDKKALLNKAKKWIKEKYGDLDVIKKDEKTNKEEDENEKGKKSEKFKFEGFTDNALCIGVDSDYNCLGLTYIIELRFKDGEYRFKPNKILYKPNGKNNRRIELKKSSFHSDDGSLDEIYEKAPSQIEDLLNGLNKSLFNYLKDKDEETEW